MDGRKQLAEAFDAWVERHGWSQKEVAEMGGPSTSTQTKIVQTSERLSAQTCRKIDTVMRWAPGTAFRVQAGEDIPESTVSEVPRLRAPRPDSFSVRADRDEVGDFVYRGQYVKNSHGAVAEVNITYRPGEGRWIRSTTDMTPAVSNAMRELLKATSSISEHEEGGDDHEGLADPAQKIDGGELTPTTRGDVTKAARYGSVPDKED